jgi:asparagine synthase (glutamine-hydrolysing)
MCGIAGIAMRRDAPPPGQAALAALAQALHHRGPDGSGATSAGQVAMVHTRLAIIDLVTGDQPFFAHDAALIANGEIYNYRELQAALHGTNFATASDCEPPLHLWHENPDHFAQRLRGMYAIAIHNRQTGSLTLSRDPFGIKPLYTCEIPGGMAFASEPQALLRAGLARRQLRPQARAELLQLQFTTGRHTIFTGIDRVLPGETHRIENGAIAATSRIDPLPPGGPEPITEAAALTNLDAALMQSVALHQRSDVPFGMFLSGGIDSAAILACMARIESRPLAYTAAFDVANAADERAAAAATARAAGARHETLLITQADMLRHLPAIAACMDDPAADYAIIPTWLLARRARQDVKMVISGEGGDEILAGYGRYRHAIRPWWQGGRPMRRHGTFHKLDVLREDPAKWRTQWAEAETTARTPGRSPLQAAQAADAAEWLPNDLLAKLDRCLMAHAVEGRTPLLDPGVAAATWRLPDALKLRHNQGKYLLRAWLAKALPEARPFAPKQGFTVPVGAWIAAVGARLGPLVAAQPGIAEIAHRDRVEALLRTGAHRHGAAAWALLFYALWHNAHVLERRTDGDVFEALSQK